MAYAIIKVGSKQFRVNEGDVINVPLLSREPGDKVEFDILARGDKDTLETGDPLLGDSKVAATIIEHGRDDKVIVFKKKRRKQYKKTHGHRQDFTSVRIDSI